MSRLLAIKGTDGEREVDYSSLSQKVIQKRIKGYEKKHGSFARFLRYTIVRTVHRRII